MGRKLNYERIRDMRSAGMTIDVIAATHNAHPRTIQRALEYGMGVEPARELPVSTEARQTERDMRACWLHLIDLKRAEHSPYKTGDRTLGDGVACPSIPIPEKPEPRAVADEQGELVILPLSLEEVSRRRRRDLGLLGLSEAHWRLSDLMRIVTIVSGQTAREIMSEYKYLGVVKPRQMFFWLARYFTTKSFPCIAEYCGGRDHTTAIHAVKRIDEIVRTLEPPGEDTPEAWAKLLIETPWPNGFYCNRSGECSTELAQQAN